MTIPGFLDDLRRRGIALRLQGDQLIAVPGSRLASEDADRIRANKPAIVQLLRDGQPGPRVLPFRSDCVTCGAALGASSAVRCRPCVARAYEDRERRRHQDGRSPPDAA